MTPTNSMEVNAVKKDKEARGAAHASLVQRLAWPPKQGQPFPVYKQRHSTVQHSTAQHDMAWGCACHAASFAHCRALEDAVPGQHNPPLKCAVQRHALPPLRRCGVASSCEMQHTQRPVLHCSRSALFSLNLTPRQQPRPCRGICTAHTPTPSTQTHPQTYHPAKHSPSAAAAAAASHVREAAASSQAEIPRPQPCKTQPKTAAATKTADTLRVCVRVSAPPLTNPTQKRSPRGPSTSHQWTSGD